MAKAKKSRPEFNLVLSWSGERSKKVAAAFREWLPTVLQAAKPWMSDDDIAKGSAWQGSLGEQLEACKVGVMFLTPENLTANWLHFEAGALSKPIRKGRVSTVLLADVKPSDVPGPLGIFQHTSPTQDDVRKLVLSVADAIDADVTKEALKASFDNGWEKIKGVLTLEPLTGQAERRTDRQLLEELIELTREINRSQNRRGIGDGSPASADLFRTLTSPNLSPNLRQRFFEYVDLKAQLNRATEEMDSTLAELEVRLPGTNGPDSGRDRDNK